MKIIKLIVITVALAKFSFTYSCDDENSEDLEPFFIQFSESDRYRGWLFFPQFHEQSEVWYTTLKLFEGKELKLRISTPFSDPRLIDEWADLPEGYQYVQIDATASIFENIELVVGYKNTPRRGEDGEFYVTACHPSVKIKVSDVQVKNV